MSPASNRSLADLKAEIEAERLKTTEEAERSARLEKELQKLKYDDASQKAERVKRLSSTLTVAVPQVLADLQKFFAEKDLYDEDIRSHLLEQSTYLANYVADQLDS